MYTKAEVNMIKRHVSKKMFGPQSTVYSPRFKKSYRIVDVLAQDQKR